MVNGKQREKIAKIDQTNYWKRRLSSMINNLKTPTSLAFLAVFAARSVAHNGALEPVIRRLSMIRRSLLAMCFSLVAAAAAAQTTTWPNQKDGDYVIKDFRFGSGETIPALKMHYRTLGTAKRNAQGEIVNGILLLHGTSGSGNSWLLPSLAD